jgi:hypothetical protein
MPRALSAHAAARARDRSVKTTAPEACEQEDALAPRTPAASSLRKRTSSTENLVAAARLVRSESQKQLLQHAQMLATGASTSGALGCVSLVPSARSAPLCCVCNLACCVSHARWRRRLSVGGGVLGRGRSVELAVRGACRHPPCAPRPRDTSGHPLTSAPTRGSRASRPPTSHTTGTTLAPSSASSRSAACPRTGAWRHTLRLRRRSLSLAVSLAHTACAQPAAWRPPTRWCAV